jgi:hypothetical protein
VSGEPPFPQPRTLADVVTYGADRALAREIFARVTRADAHPFGRPDGADKSLRLLSSGGWLFKTHPEQRISDFHTLLGVLSEVSRFEWKLGVWHPHKRWFVLHDGRDNWLCNTAPILTRLDQLTGTQAFVRGLEQWLRVAYTLHRHGLVLDPHLDNFGVRGRFGPVYYLDDEVYRRSGTRLHLVNPAAQLRHIDDRKEVSQKTPIRMHDVTL